MASSGAGEQYIGSKIWLISKAEIRYEGILHSIDPNESTLALASVRSHGTEDRPAERVVAPREEVFELILFRASDIKDIRLCDTPKPAPPPPERTAPYDPAIIQVQSSAPGSFPAGGLHHPGAMAPHIRPGAFMVPPYAGYGGAFGPGAGLGQNLMPPVPTPTLGQSTITFSGIGTDLGPVGPPPHPDGPSEDESGLLGGPKSEASTPLPPSEPDVGSRKVSESEGRVDDGVTSKAAAHGQRRDDHRRSNRGYQDNRGYQQRDYEDRRGGYRGGRGYDHRGGRGGYESRGGRGGYRDQGRDTTQASASAKPVGGSKLKFEQDYDFERANQDFERVMQQLSKTKISDTTTPTAVSKESTAENGDVDSDAGNGEVTPKPASEQLCYNKTKSFFDTISCEALERSKGGYQRPDWQKERQLNSETFGLKPPNPHGGYRRGYYNRDYGYRGQNYGNNYRNNYNRDVGYNRDGGYYRDNRDGFNRDYRGGYGYRGGYRSNNGGYENRGRGRGDGTRGGYRGGRGGRNHDEHDDRTERTEKPEGRSERGRGSYASRV